MENEVIKENLENNNIINNINNNIINNKKKDFIIKEIKNKLKLLISISIISLIFSLLSLIFVILCLVGNTKPEGSNVNWWYPITEHFLFNLYIQIALFLFFFYIFIVSTRFLYKIRSEKEYYYSNYQNFDLNRIPNFIKYSYKHNLKNIIFLNWFLLASFFWSTIILVILFLSDGKANFKFLWTEIKITPINESNYYKDSYLEDNETSKIIVYIFLSFISVIYIIFTIINFKSNNKLNLLFDLNNKLDNNEINKHKRNSRLLAAAFFWLIPVLFLFFYWLKRNWKKK